MQTDRNLLFGVLAFQDEYIDLAQLAAICRAWAADKSRSIPQLLAERQWLSEPERDELERKVERKLKRFVGDVHATLGAVADGAVRDVLKQVNDPDISESLSSWPDSGHVLMETLVPDSQSSAKTFSRYTLTNVHGKGGIGQVWLAYDKQLNREVALKELRPDRSRGPDVWRRFLREAQITGQLQHPNIVPVYDLDRRVVPGLTTDRQEKPFYTMKLVQGRTLRDAIATYHEQRRAGRARTLELNQLLQSFVSVCQAIAYAHSRGVVHRDLKPHNIVLGDFGEVIVLDWGEAKLIGTPETASAEETVSETSQREGETPGEPFPNQSSAAEAPGTVAAQREPRPADQATSFRLQPVSVTPEAEPEHRTVAGQPTPGTPAYMSPEQAAGRLDQIEPRTDVYGLGAILFDIVTGQAPHRLEPGETVKDLFPRIVAQPTPRARERDATIPVSLDAICATAMAGALTSRYSSANELAQDVQRFLADEPVSCIREPLIVRARRWVKQHRMLVTAFSAAAFALLVTLGPLVLSSVLFWSNFEREGRIISILDEMKLSSEKDLQMALEDLESSQRMAAADPNDVTAQRDVFVSYAQLGDKQFEHRLVPEAQRTYQKCLMISQQLVAADPSDTQAHLDLVVSYQKIAAVQLRQKQFEQSVETLGRGLKVLRSLKDQQRLPRANEYWIEVFEQAIAECREFQEESRR